MYLAKGTFFLEKKPASGDGTASHELDSLPREMPDRRSSAVADVKPTSAKSKVKDLAEFCQLMTTEYNNKHDIIDSLGSLSYLLQLNHRRVVQPIRHGHLYIFS